MGILWDNTTNEKEALFNYMVEMAFSEDTQLNETVKNEVWHSEILLKYFNHEQFKHDLLSNGQTIIESQKGYAVVNRG